jgi:hypothetical protein
MPRYRKNHWTVRLARFAYRLQRAIDDGIQLMWNEDFATYHFEGRSLTRIEELQIWCSGFRESWLNANFDGDAWFELAESTPEELAAIDR